MKKNLFIKFIFYNQNYWKEIFFLHFKCRAINYKKCISLTIVCKPQSWNLVTQKRYKYGNCNSLCLFSWSFFPPSVQQLFSSKAAPLSAAQIKDHIAMCNLYLIVLHDLWKHSESHEVSCPDLTLDKTVNNRWLQTWGLTLLTNSKQWAV